MSLFEQRGAYIHAHLVYGFVLGGQDGGWRFREIDGDGNPDPAKLSWLDSAPGEYVSEDEFIAGLEKQAQDYAVTLLKTGDPEDYGQWLLVDTESAQMKADGPDVHEVDPNVLVHYDRISPAREVLWAVLEEAGLTMTDSRPRWYLTTTWH